MTRARDLAAFVSNADGDIKFDTDTLFIDSSANKVGIGTTAPDDYYSDNLVVSAPSEGGITIANQSTSGNNYLMFADGTSGNAAYRGQIAYNHTDDKLLLATAGSTRATITSSGNVGIGTSSPHDAGANFSILTLNGAKGGGIVFSDDDVNQHMINTTDDNSLRFTRGSGLSNESIRILSGGGITFNGDTAAANALNDYEEGSFTPTTADGIALNSASGIYRKIGKVVHVGMKFTIASNSNSSAATITSLPFTVANDDSARAGIVISWNSNGQGNAGLDFLLVENTTTGIFYLDGSSKGYSALSNDTIYMGGTYPVA